ncbi:uncharacterized protein CBL_01691 [Carabus blaptoides fortunei]
MGSATNKEDDNTSSSQELLSAIVQIRKVTSRDEESVREDSQMTVYNISEIPDNYGTQTNDVAIQTSIAPSMTQRQPYVCPYIMAYHENMMRNEQTNVPVENGFIQKSKYIKQVANDGRSRLANFFGLTCKTDTCKGQCDMYKINIEQAADDKSPPRKLVFDLIDEPPKTDMKNTGTNTKDMTKDGIHTHDVHFVDSKYPISPSEKRTTKSKLAAERMDIYYFDHGNTEYFRTTDAPPVLMTDYLAERTEYYTKRFWAQLFGTIHIGVSFITSFILQLIRFLLQALIRPLTVGLVQLFADYFLKPCLTVLFNGLVQPPMIFLYNVATSVRDVCEPIATGIGYFLREIAVLFKAIRLVQVDTGKRYSGN